MDATTRTSAARRFVNEARARRARLSMEDPERHFYRGVEAAANDVLHPELRNARPDTWFDREETTFREGYLRTSIKLSAVATSDGSPFVGLPEYT